MSSPSFPVIADITFRGGPNVTDRAASACRKIGEDPKELLQGALLALESVTSEAPTDPAEVSDHQAATDSEDDDGGLTEKCRLEVAKLFSKAPDQRPIFTPREDVFLAWIHSVNRSGVNQEKKIGADGTAVEVVDMHVAVLSFPQYGFMRRKVQENLERQQAFKDELQRKLALKSTSAEDKQDIMNRVKEFEASLYDPRPHLKVHDVAVTNVWFQRRSKGPGPGHGGPSSSSSSSGEQHQQQEEWLISNLSFKPGREAMGVIGNFRWRGRVALSLRGMKFINVLRADYITDYLFLSGLFFIFLFLVLAL